MKLLKNNLLRLISIIGICSIFYCCILCSCTEKKTPVIIGPNLPGGGESVSQNLEAWTEGNLDLHFINTATGESIFVIMPDGTQMLIDCASSMTTDGNTEIKTRWSGTTQRASQQICDYIKKCMKWTNNQKIDYFALTHFHPDHMGTYKATNPKSSNGDWTLNGVTDIFETFTVGKMVDRGYPDYNYPIMQKTSASIINYNACAAWNASNNGTVREMYSPGSNTQFVQNYKPDLYPVEIRVLSCNGVFWTGKGASTEMRFPKLEEITSTEIGKGNCPCENNCSGTIVLSYGKFDVFLGGDTSVRSMSTYAWNDTETPLSKLVGEVDVMKANHHGSVDACYQTILDALTPQAMVINVWQDVQPRPADTWNKRMSKMIGTDFFLTNLATSNKNNFTGGLDLIKSEYGHVVVRVDKGGEKFRVYALDDKKTDFTIKTYKTYVSK